MTDTAGSNGRSTEGAPTRKVLRTVLERSEDGLAGVVLVAMAVLPVTEVVARRVPWAGFPASATVVQQLTLWIAFLGAALAAREGKLLSLATAELLPAGRVRRLASIVSAGIAAGVSVLLARGSFDLLLIEREAATKVAGVVPVWVVQSVLPFSFSVVALRLVWRSSPTWPGRALASLGIAVGLWLGQFQDFLDGRAAWPGLGLILVGTLLGGPLFAAIGGVAVLLFLSEGIPAAAVPVETYRMAVSPHLPAIPLFTLTGFLLAEGDVAGRLLRLFRALFGWVPGGTAVVCAALCAFLTVFTGGSGVTILVVGGLLFEALRQDGYRTGFSLGLLTASGSLGLLLPPALPLILYGIVAQVRIESLFIGGILPGLLLVGLVAAWGMREGMKRGTGRTPFRWKETAGALWAAKLEVLLPVFVVVVLFGGFATLVEIAALTSVYAFVLQTLVHRNVSLRRDALRVLRDCTALVGGVLLILGVAMGLTSYLVDAEIPAAIVEWVREHVDSKLAFLLALNLFLLVVGCLMDVFSATVVVVPLIVPLGEAFGIDPVHLGIIFIANLELGYLTPPVGLNLFLASYRFQRPLLEVYRASLPMLAILGIGVLLITYVPVLTTGLVALFAP